MGEGEEVQSELLVARAEAAAVLQAADGLLDAEAFAIRALVKALAARTRLIATAWNDRLDAAGRG